MRHDAEPWIRASGRHGASLPNAVGRVVAAGGGGWRRVVASPRPRAIVEVAAIRILLRRGVLVVAVGGGTYPIVLDDNGAGQGDGVAMLRGDAATSIEADIT